MAASIFFVGLLIFLGHLFSAIFEKTRIPDVLPLVMLGLILGPFTGWVTPSSFGKIGEVFTTVSLIIILFQSGLDLKLTHLKNSWVSGMKLTIINFVFAMTFVTLAGIYVFRLPTLSSLVMGAILAGTSFAIVIPIISKLRVTENSKTALLVESTIGDMLCIVVTLALLQIVSQQRLETGLVIGNILSVFLLAGIIGFLAAVFWTVVLHKVRELENGIFLTPAFVLVVYGLSEFLGFSGAISALCFGIAAGNIQGLQELGIGHFKSIEFNQIEKAFFAEIVFLLKTFFFIYIGIAMKVTNISILFLGFLLTAGILFIRIPGVLLSVEKTVSRFDASVISIMGPKGLVAAVLASLVVQKGLALGGFIQDMVYSVVLFSVMLSAILAFLIEKNKLKKFFDTTLSKYKDELQDKKAEK